MKWALLILAVLGTLAPVGASSRGTVKPWKLPPCNIENAANRSLPLAGQLGERFSLVLFWSTPCSSCLAKIRDVRAFSKAHEEDVALVMINTDPPAIANSSLRGCDVSDSARAHFSTATKRR